MGANSWGAVLRGVPACARHNSKHNHQPKATHAAKGQKSAGVIAGPQLLLAAAALRSSRSALGAYYRRLCARMDKGKAVTAAAHKLARMVYLMLTRGEEYADQGQLYCEERYRERVVRGLTKKAAELGVQFTSAAITA